MRLQTMLLIHYAPDGKRKNRFPGTAAYGTFGTLSRVRESGEAAW